MSSTRQMKKTTRRNIKIKLLKSNDEKKITKASMEKIYIIYTFKIFLTIYYGASNVHHSKTYYNNSIKIWKGETEACG